MTVEEEGVERERRLTPESPKRRGEHFTQSVAVHKAGHNTGRPMSSWTGFCCLGFGMFHHPAWAVGSYSSGPAAGGTPLI